MDGVQLPQGYRAITRKQFTFYHYVPGISQNDERLIKLIELGATQWFLTQKPYSYHRMIG